MILVPELCEHLIARQDALLGRMRSLADDDWYRPTRCPGWRVRDVAWHVAWGRGAGEVIQAARDGSDPIPYVTSRIGPAPDAAHDIVAAMQAKCEATTADLRSLSPDEQDMMVRYGRPDPQPLRNYLWALIVEAFVHGDDLDTAVGIDGPMSDVIAAEIVRRLVHGAVGRARADGLQPKEPRGYGYISDRPLAGFFFDGREWSEGFSDHPTCFFESDTTTLARVVMGRIPIAPWEGTARRPWDDRLRVAGDVTAAPPLDVMRWCYGAW